MLSREERCPLLGLGFSARRLGFTPTITARIELEECYDAPSDFVFDRETEREPFLPGSRSFTRPMSSQKENFQENCRPVPISIRFLCR